MRLFSQLPALSEDPKTLITMDTIPAREQISRQ